MSIINIAVSIILASRIGVAGVLLGTIISRVVTQLWYDPMLIYKRVFNIPISKYFMLYGSYFFVMCLSCMLASFGIKLVNIYNMYIAFIVKGIIAAMVPIFVVTLLYSQTEEYQYLLKLVKKMVFKKSKRNDRL